MDTPSQYVIIRYNGKIYKVRKSPQENNENATVRAWYIVKELPVTLSFTERECKSHIWLNTKYFGMNYRYD